MKKKIRFLSVKLITEDDDYYKKLNIDILYGGKKNLTGPFVRLR